MMYGITPEGLCESKIYGGYGVGNAEQPLCEQRAEPKPKTEPERKPRRKPVPPDESKRPVMVACVSDGREFDSMAEAAREYGMAYKTFAARMKASGYCKAGGKSFTVVR